MKMNQHENNQGLKHEQEFGGQVWGKKRADLSVKASPENRPLVMCAIRSLFFVSQFSLESLKIPDRIRQIEYKRLE